MSSRKSRLSLTKDPHKDKDVKTPNARRSLARTSKGKISPESQRIDENYEVSPSQSSDYSPMVPSTQDNSFHAINGVSWEWNSPQRLRDQQQQKIIAANSYKHNPPLRPKYSDLPDKVPNKKPTGFNKFISKLNLLMEKENIVDDQLNTVVSEPTQQSETNTVTENENVAEDQFNTAISEPIQHSELNEESCLIDEFFIASDEEQGFTLSTKGEDSDDDIFQKHTIETPVKKSAPTGTDLDDSKLDFLLIEASQTIEQRLNNPPCPPPRPMTHSPPQIQQEPVPRPKSIPCRLSIPIEMNDSDMDGFLIQASLMVEEKLSDSSQESSSNSNAQQTVNHPTSGITSYAQLDGPVPPNDDDKRDTATSTAATKGSTSEAMSQEELKALIGKKRQEALRRLQTNRLKRGIKGTNSHG
ncbi:uncharacterized protein LOC128708965 [Anopheles marshallii]|uniref:uncharacterized protein LOC128708965 n=1 Tax=Anopheles marshallii TaxID=1521116 RepID=UPI00237AC873|nr:uncharacterized protein LOC128708965 [Anopheles marshallii]